VAGAFARVTIGVVLFPICACGVGGVEEHVVHSIFLWGNAGFGWFSAGVQTLLLAPAFREACFSKTALQL
jgi:hypothetical protein